MLGLKLSCNALLSALLSRWRPDQNFPEGTIAGPYLLLLNLSYLGTCICRHGETCLL